MLSTGISHPFLSIVVFPERNPPIHRLLMVLEIHRCLPHLLSVFLSRLDRGTEGGSGTRKPPGARPISQTHQPPAPEAFSASLQAAGTLDRPDPFPARRSSPGVAEVLRGSRLQALHAKKRGEDRTMRAGKRGDWSIRMVPFACLFRSLSLTDDAHGV